MVFLSSIIKSLTTGVRAVVIWAGPKEFAAKSIGDAQASTPAVGVIVG